MVIKENMKSEHLRYLKPYQKQLLTLFKYMYKLAFIENTITKKKTIYYNTYMEQNLTNTLIYLNIYISKVLNLI